MGGRVLMVVATPGEAGRDGRADITIPAGALFFPAVLDFAQSLAAGLGFVEREQNQIRLALEELLCFLNNNAFIGPESVPLTISFCTQADGLTMRIIEQGMPLDTNNLPSFSPDRVEEDFLSDGLSLFLAKGVMDTVSFINRGRAGLEVVLLKRRSSSHIKAIHLPADTPADRPEAPGPALDTYRIRPARETDALDISRCAYAVYGYSYEDFIYYPERVAEMNRSGLLRSLVAVNEEHTMMGHCALKIHPDNPGHAELGVVIVRPEYRRHGLGAALWQAAVEHARSLGLDSVHVRSVTGHQASQTIARQTGFRDCALFLALFPRAVDLKQLGGRQPGKMSGMLQWLCLKKTQTRHLDLPGRYRRMLRRLYEHNGIAVIEQTPPPPADHTPLLRTEEFDIFNVAVMSAELIGPDEKAAVAWLTSAVRLLCRKKRDAIYLLINLAHDGATTLADAAAEHGFILCGLFPHAFVTGDALVMQYVNLAEDPFSHLVVDTEEAALLRDFIRDEWHSLC